MVENGSLLITRYGFNGSWHEGKRRKRRTGGDVSNVARGLWQLRRIRWAKSYEKNV